jgi:hypothetical protein
VAKARHRSRGRGALASRRPGWSAAAYQPPPAQIIRSSHKLLALRRRESAMLTSILNPEARPMKPLALATILALGLLAAGSATRRGIWSGGRSGHASPTRCSWREPCGTSSGAGGT